MSTPEDDDDKGHEPLSLTALAPREAWVRGLPALGTRAAKLREEAADESLGAGLRVAARWFLPLATVSTAACWVLALQFAPARERVEPNAAILVAGANTDAETIELLLSSRGRHE